MRPMVIPSWSDCEIQVTPLMPLGPACGGQYSNMEALNWFRSKGFPMDERVWQWCEDSRGARYNPVWLWCEEISLFHVQEKEGSKED